MIKELDPDIGLRIASGSTSVGKFILLKIGPKEYKSINV